MQSVMVRQRSIQLIAVVLLISISNGLTTPAGCAPLDDVRDALEKAQLVAAEQFGPTEAEDLMDILKGKAMMVGGLVCFMSGDFSEFGHIVAQLIATQQKDTGIETEVRQDDEEFTPIFNSSDEDDLGVMQTCRCTACPSGYESWCASSSSIAQCCPHICANIFSTISVGALIGIKSSGVDSCCEDGAKRCSDAQPPNTTNLRGNEDREDEQKSSSPPSSQEQTPDFDFSTDTVADPSAVSPTSTAPSTESPAPSKENIQSDDRGSMSSITSQSPGANRPPTAAPSRVSRPSPSPSKVPQEARRPPMVFSLTNDKGESIFQIPTISLGSPKSANENERSHGPPGPQAVNIANETEALNQGAIPPPETPVSSETSKTSRGGEKLPEPLPQAPTAVPPVTSTTTIEDSDTMGEPPPGAQSTAADQINVPNKGQSSGSNSKDIALGGMEPLDTNSNSDAPFTLESGDERHSEEGEETPSSATGLGSSATKGPFNASTAAEADSSLQKLPDTPSSDALKHPRDSGNDNESMDESPEPSEAPFN